MCWWLLGPGLLYMLVGALLLVRPARKPNTWYGYRTPRSLRDQRSWVVANTFAAWGIVVVGFFSANAGLMCALLRLDVERAWWTVGLLTAAMSFAGVLATERWVGKG